MAMATLLTSGISDINMMLNNRGLPTCGISAFISHFIDNNSPFLTTVRKK